MPFTGQVNLEARPDCSPLGIKFNFSDERPRSFSYGSPPPNTISHCITFNSPLSNIFEAYVNLVEYSTLATITSLLFKMLMLILLQQKLKPEERHQKKIKENSNSFSLEKLKAVKHQKQ